MQWLCLGHHCNDSWYSSCLPLPAGQAWRQEGAPYPSTTQPAPWPGKMQLFLKEENLQKLGSALVKAEALFSLICRYFPPGNFTVEIYTHCPLCSFQNVLSFLGKRSVGVHMPMAMKQSSRNQSSLFFSLDSDQVAEKGKTPKHREYPTVHAMTQKKNWETFGKDFSPKQ